MKNTLKLLLALGALVLGVSTMRPSSAVVSNQNVITTSAVGNGSTTNYTIGFTFQHNSDLRVYLKNESTLTSTAVTFGVGAGKYTLSAGDPATTVIMGTAPTSNQRVIIVRQSPLTQTVNYDDNSPFPSEDHEAAMDKTILIVQEQARALTQKIGLSTISAYSAPTFPDPYADRFIGYNHAGTDLTRFPPISSTIASGDTMRFDGSSWDRYPLDSTLATLSAGLQASIDTHIANHSNPHAVTAAQLGGAAIKSEINSSSGQINWSQVSKSGSSLSDLASRSHTELTDKGTNTHAQIDSHISSVANPHSVTAAQVGNTVAQWNANKIQGVTVDDSAIGDLKVLAYRSGPGTIQYVTVPALSTPTVVPAAPTATPIPAVPTATPIPADTYWSVAGNIPGSSARILGTLDDSDVLFTANNATLATMNAVAGSISINSVTPQATPTLVDMPLNVVRGIGIEGDGTTTANIRLEDGAGGSSPPSAPTNGITLYQIGGHSSREFHLLTDTGQDLGFDMTEIAVGSTLLGFPSGFAAGSHELVDTNTAQAITNKSLDGSNTITGLNLTSINYGSAPLQNLLVRVASGGALDTTAFPGVNRIWFSDGGAPPDLSSSVGLRYSDAFGLILSPSNARTDNTPTLNASQSWANGTIDMQALKLNVTLQGTGAKWGSRLIDLQTNTVSQFKVSKDGDMTLRGTMNVNTTSYPPGFMRVGATGGVSSTSYPALGSVMVSGGATGDITGLAPGNANTIIASNGTAWVVATPTSGGGAALPTPGPAGAPLISDGTNFVASNTSYPASSTQWKSNLNFEVSAGWGTITDKSILYRREGPDMIVRGYFQAGTVAASSAYIQLPAGYTMDFTQMVTWSSGIYVGRSARLSSTTQTLALGPGNEQVLFSNGSTNNQIYFAYQTTSESYAGMNVNAAFGAGEGCAFEFRVPITGW